MALVLACNVMLHVFRFRVAVTTAEQMRSATRRITAVAAIMCGAFFVALALFSTSPHDIDFIVGATSRLENPGSVALPVGLAWVVVMVPLGLSCTSHAIRAFRWAANARRESQLWLHVGMRIKAVGYLLAVTYCSHSALYQIAEVVGWIPSWKQSSVTDFVVTSAPALVFVGTVVPVTGAWLTERREAAALLRRLQPISLRLVPQVPFGTNGLKTRLRHVWQRQWHPATVVYEMMIDLEDVYLRIQREIPATLSHDAAEMGRLAGLNSEARRSLVVAAAAATWTTIPRNTDRTDAAVQSQTERIVHVLIEHMDRSNSHSDKPENAANSTPNMALTIDLDRWLRAADMLAGFSIDLKNAPAGQR